MEIRNISEVHKHNYGPKVSAVYTTDTYHVHLRWPIITVLTRASSDGECLVVIENTSSYNCSIHIAFALPNATFSAVLSVLVSNLLHDGTCLLSVQPNSRSTT